MRQLDKAIDSLKKQNALFGKQTEAQYLPSLPFINYLDSNWKKLDSPVKLKA
jgi:hypothetical protein